MKNMTLINFVDQLASNSPVPGGGSVAAVSGALGAALSEMVANLTIGKKKYIESEEVMKEIVVKATALRNTLLDDIQRDSDSYDRVISAYKMPKETEDEKNAREKEIQESLKIAATVPFEIAQTAYEIMPLAETVIEKGNSNAVTDGLVACMMSRTAVLSALLNVKINLGSINDEKFVSEMKLKVNDIESKTVAYEKKVLEKSPF